MKVNKANSNIITELETKNQF